MDKNMFESWLRIMERECEELLKSNYNEGGDKLKNIYSKVEIMIRRIYPNYQEVKHSLIGDSEFIWDDDYIKNPQKRQEWFIENVKTILRGIQNIGVENSIFGLENFTPLKEKTETSWGVSKDTFGFLKKKTKER